MIIFKLHFNCDFFILKWNFNDIMLYYSEDKLINNMFKFLGGYRNA